MPRKNLIAIRTGSGTPSAGSFSVGEPAFDPSTGTLWVRGSSSMVEIGAGGGGGSAEVLEYSSPAAFPSVGAVAKIYVSTSTSRLYRFDASGVYVEIGGRGVSGPDGGSFA